MDCVNIKFDNLLSTTFMVTRGEDFTPMNWMVNYSDQNRIDNSGKIATCKKLSKLFMHLLRLDSPPSQTTVHV